MTNYPLFNFFILFSERLSSVWEPQGCPCEKELCVPWEDFWRVRSSLSMYVCVKKLKGVRSLTCVFCLGQTGNVCRLAHRCSLHNILSSSCSSLEHWKAGTRWRVQLSLLTGNLPLTEERFQGGFLVPLSGALLFLPETHEKASPFSFCFHFARETLLCYEQGCTWLYGHLKI